MVVAQRAVIPVLPSGQTQGGISMSLVTAVSVHVLLLIGIGFAVSQHQVQRPHNPVFVELVPTHAGSQGQDQTQADPNAHNSALVSTLTAPPPEQAEPAPSLPAPQVIEQTPVEPPPVIQEATPTPEPEPLAPPPLPPSPEPIQTTEVAPSKPSKPLISAQTKLQTPEQEKTESKPTKPAPAKSTPVASATPARPVVSDAAQIMQQGLQLAERGELNQDGQQGKEKRLTGQSTTTEEDFYLQGWERKVRILGEQNFPKEALKNGVIKCPTLEMAIRADGSLAEVRVVRPCADDALTQAAVSIVRRASPYAPFPRALKRQYEVLRFQRLMSFDSGRVGAR